MWNGNFLLANSALLNKRNLYFACHLFSADMSHIYYLADFKVKLLIGVHRWHVVSSLQIQKLNVNTCQAETECQDNCSANLNT